MLLKIFKPVFLVISLALFFLTLCPKYLQKGLIYWYANIDDYKISYNDTVAISSPIEWKLSEKYNTFTLKNDAKQYLEKYKTVAFLVIKNGNILFEKYWDNYNESSYSNLFSATKSIVSILIGIAIKEGHINSVNDPIGWYIPEFSKDKRGNITIKNLLTMSSGLDWVETYTSPFSITTKAYYGTEIRNISISQKLITDPGKIYKYQSGNTQLLGFIIEYATKKSINTYAAEKLWKPLGAKYPAIWSVDKQGGDERTFCCFYTNARDIAKVGQLILKNGKWKGKQLIPKKYVAEMIKQATYLLDTDSNKPCDFYGYHWWILSYKDLTIPYMRGHHGQYIYIVPEKDAIIIRLGKEKDTTKKGSITLDIEKFVEIGLNILDNKQ